MGTTLRRVIYCQAVVLSAIGLLWIGAVLPLPFDPDYTAGELLDHILAWNAGEPLYPPLDEAAHRVLNYPPAYPLMVRIGMAAGLSPLIAGRGLSLAAMCLTMWVVYQWLRHLSQPREAAWVGVLLALTNFPALFLAPQLHLQWPAVACTIAGWYLGLVCAQHARWILIGGVLTSLAVFFKQTQCIPAAAALGWCLVYRRDRAKPFAIGMIVAAGVGAIAIWQGYGPQAWRHLIEYTTGSFSSAHWGKMLLENILPAGILIGLAGWCGLKHPSAHRDPRWWYFLSSAIWIVGAAREGSGPQYVLECFVAAALWIVPFIRGARPMAAALILHFLVMDVVVGARLMRQMRRVTDDTTALASVCATLPPPPAKILTEHIGWLRSCGHAAAWHPFIMVNLTQRGIWDERPMVEALHRGEYAALVLPFNPTHPVAGVSADRWSAAMVAAMRTAYIVSEQRGRFYILRPVALARASH